MFYALWIPDLFMERVRDNGKWSLFCPNDSPDLAECRGEEFDKMYTQYEKEVNLNSSFLLERLSALLYRLRTELCFLKLRVRRIRLYLLGHSGLRF